MVASIIALSAPASRRSRIRRSAAAAATSATLARNLVDDGALGGLDPVLGHARAVFDQDGSIVLRLADDASGLVAGAFEQKGDFGVGAGGLGFIFGAQGLCVGANLRGLVQMQANAGNFPVERLADRGRHLLPDHQQEEGEHGQRDPAGGVEAPGFRLGMAAAMVLGGRRQFVMTGRDRTFMRDGLGRGGMRFSHGP
jgi:hypothetical protein